MVDVKKTAAACSGNLITLFLKGFLVVLREKLPWHH